MNMNKFHIPTDVLKAARLLTTYFAEQNIKEWQLDGCQNRSAAHPPREPTHDLMVALEGCAGCDYDEAEGELFNHCDACCRKITALAWDVYATYASTPIAADAGEGIYVASRVVRAPMWRELRDQGWPIVSSWIDEDGEDETDDFGELWRRIRREIAGSRGLVFYGDVADAPWKGALVEVGIALALNKPVAAFVVGDLDERTMRPVGSWLHAVQRCGSLTEALEVAGAAPPAPVVDNAKRTQEGDLPRASGQNLHGRTLSAAGVAKPADEQPSPAARAPSADEELVRRLRAYATSPITWPHNSPIATVMREAASALEAAAKREGEHADWCVAHQKEVDDAHRSAHRHLGRIEALEAELKRAESLAESYKSALAVEKTQLEKQRSEIHAMREHQAGSVWYWQGDGGDHPESLTCPVVMRAQQVRDCLSVIETATALADQLPQGASSAFYCNIEELTKLRAALKAARALVGKGEGNG